MTEAFVAGLLGGLAVALPLGAIGLLILQTGMTAGRRPAFAGATAVATVDLLYAVAAVTAGALVADRIAPHQREIRTAGAVVLLLVAARGLWGLRRPASSTAIEPGRAFLRFFTLTAINPLTAVSFTVLATGLSGTLRGAGSRAAFASGIFLASWAWQLVLAAAGAAGGHRLPPAARTCTALAGYALVAALAVRLALT